MTSKKQDKPDEPAGGKKRERTDENPIGDLDGIAVYFESRPATPSHPRFFSRHMLNCMMLV